jgi:hypothetical protein
MTRAGALKQCTEKGKHYGLLTAKCRDALEALLWSFHNARSGLCFPSLEKIAEKAKVARSCRTSRAWTCSSFWPSGSICDI